MRHMIYNIYTQEVYMLFEYDEHKNELNIEKHKVSFEEAQEI